MRHFLYNYGFEFSAFREHRMVYFAGPEKSEKQFGPLSEKATKMLDELMNEETNKEQIKANIQKSLMADGKIDEEECLRHVNDMQARLMRLSSVDSAVGVNIKEAMNALPKTPADIVNFAVAKGLLTPDELLSAQRQGILRDQQTPSVRKATTGRVSPGKNSEVKPRSRMSYNQETKTITWPDGTSMSMDEYRQFSQAKFRMQDEMNRPTGLDKNAQTMKKFNSMRGGGGDMAHDYFDRKANMENIGKVQLGYVPRTGNDDAIDAHRNRLKSTGNIQMSSTYFENPNLQRTRFDKNGLQFDDQKNFRKNLRKDGVNVPEPRDTSEQSVLKEKLIESIRRKVTDQFYEEKKSVIMNHPEFKKYYDMWNGSADKKGDYEKLMALQQDGDQAYTMWKKWENIVDSMIETNKGGTSQAKKATSVDAPKDGPTFTPSKIEGPRAGMGFSRVAKTWTTGAETPKPSIDSAPDTVGTPEWFKPLYNDAKNKAAIKENAIVRRGDAWPSMPTRFVNGIYEVPSPNTRTGDLPMPFVNYSGWHMPPARFDLNGMSAEQQQQTIARLQNPFSNQEEALRLNRAGRGTTKPLPTMKPYEEKPVEITSPQESDEPPMVDLPPVTQKQTPAPTPPEIEESPLPPAPAPESAPASSSTFGEEYRKAAEDIKNIGNTPEEKKEEKPKTAPRRGRSRTSSSEQKPESTDEKPAETETRKRSTFETDEE
jgi:hypothetical protein